MQCTFKIGFFREVILDYNVTALITVMIKVRIYFYLCMYEKY